MHNMLLLGINYYASCTLLRRIITLSPSSSSSLLADSNKFCGLFRLASTHERYRPRWISKKDPHNEEPGAKGRKPYVRRIGYEVKYWEEDTLMPRIKDDRVPYPIPKFKGKDPWSKDKALFGQNDYIDILGDGSIKPWDLVHHDAPIYLRHVSGRATELQRLIRKRDYVMHYWQYKYPVRWHNLIKRIRFLYKKLNIRKNRKMHK